MPLSAANIQRLEHVLAPLNPTTSAAEVRADGFLWIRTTAQGKWHRMARMRGHEVAAARAWVAAYMARTQATTTHEPAGAEAPPSKESL
jgi:hypothetical protein